MNDPICQIMLNKKNKFNHIYLIKTDVLNFLLINNIKNKSENDADYYFNIIRIYYYNYLKSKEIYDNKEIKYEKVNKKEEIKKSNEIIEKQSDENLSFNSLENTKNIKENKENTENIKENKENTKENKENTDKNNPEISEDDYKKENIFSEKYYTNYNNFLENNNIEYKSKLMIKLFKYIIRKTHPDKTSDLLMNHLFLSTVENYEVNNIAIIFLIAYSLNYKIEKLKDEEKYLLSKNITKIILIRQKLF